MKVFNISSGLSEIYLNGTNPLGGAKKAYVWPVYQEGRVEPVSPVKRDYSAPIYFKPLESQQQEIIEFLKSKDFSYDEKGFLKSENKIVEPGIFFTAFA
jgi:hypothetical protein